MLLQSSGAEICNCQRDEALMKGDCFLVGAALAYGNSSCNSYCCFDNSSVLQRHYCFSFGFFFPLNNPYVWSLKYFQVTNGRNNTFRVVLWLCKNIHVSTYAASVG